MSERPDFISVIDDAGVEKRQRVQNVVTDVRGELVYITAEGLRYASDSLTRKRQRFLIAELERIPKFLTHPDIVIWDPSYPVKDSLIYYRRVYLKALGRYMLLATIVKFRQGIKFFYNLHVQESGKVKGHDVTPRPKIEIWYIAPKKKPHQFGI